MDLFNLHIFRLVITAIVLPLLRYKISVLVLLILLVILDLLDCIKKINGSYCHSHNYQRMDKLSDLISYTYAILVFAYMFDTRTLGLFVVFILWRAIGVYKYQTINDNTILYTYPDFINSTMFVFYLSTINTTVYDNYYIFIALGMLFKILYERIHHKNSYFKLPNGYHPSTDDLVEYQRTH